MVPVPFNAYNQVPNKSVINEHRRLAQSGYFNGGDTVDHLGRRGMSCGFLDLPKKYKCTNLEWFKAQFPDERWEKLVTQSSKIARKSAYESYKKESNLSGAREMIEQILSTHEARSNYYGTKEALKHQYGIIYNSLCKPIIRMESASFMWLVKKNG